MITLHPLALLLVTTSLPTATNAHYKLTKDYSGYDFVSGFDFYNGQDPTHGHVQYKGYATANATGLAGFLIGPNGTNIDNSTLPPPIYLGVDHDNVYPTDTGRPSVRVSSVQTYNHSLIIADILHMPSSTCGLWPAFWLLGTAAPWPQSGEIDLLENVNDNDFNVMTLHTSKDLQLSNSTDLFNGTMKTSNCNVDAKDQDKNAGCSIEDKSETNSYGTNFNNNKGGVFAMQYSPDHIAIWFFPRNSIPDDIQSNSPSPPNISNATTTSAWGKPNALFQPPIPSSPPTASGTNNSDSNSTSTSNTTDPITPYFTSLQILISTTFCGDWAGQVWSTSESCKKLAPTCEEYVSAHPEAYKDAFWAIQSIKVYEDADAPAFADMGIKTGRDHAKRHLVRRFAGAGHGAALAHH